MKINKQAVVAMRRALTPPAEPPQTQHNLAILPSETALPQNVDLPQVDTDSLPRDNIAKSSEMQLKAYNTYATSAPADDEEIIVTVLHSLRQGKQTNAPEWLKTLLHVLEKVHSTDIPRADWIYLILKIVTEAFSETPDSSEKTHFITTLKENITRVMTETNDFVNIQTKKGNKFWHYKLSFIQQFMTAVITAHHMSMIGTFVTQKRGIDPLSDQTAISDPSDQVAISVPSDQAAIGTPSSKAALYQGLLILAITRVIQKELIPIAQELLFEEKRNRAIDQFIHTNEKLPNGHESKIELGPITEKLVLTLANIVSPDCAKKIKETTKKLMDKAQTRAEAIADRIVTSPVENQKRTQDIKRVLDALSAHKDLKGLASYTTKA